MAITREEILDEIRRFVTANGLIPGERAFQNATLIKESAWKGRYWIRWTEAVREAGYDPQKLNKKIPDEAMLEKLGALVLKLGYFPVRDEITLHARGIPGLPVHQTLAKRYGGMPDIVRAVLEHGQKTSNARLIELCESRLEREKLKPPKVENNGGGNADKIGYVYLKYSPSLRLYKIGKADSPNKRGIGISLLLPEDLISKHEIKTDCPYILEKYWHQRFRSKKKQGEWFELNSDDIDAFKRRREFLFREVFP